MRVRLTLALAGLSMALGLMHNGAAIAQVSVAITLAPPELPVYEQPPLPAPGYIWSPGYWAWDQGDYYWVPGTWVEAPQPGYLWTPGYWGWADGAYLWHAGYWGPHVGFYGGVNYGHGYGGNGYEGGYWRNGGFYYNRSVNNINNVQVTNVYNKTVINNVTVNRVSYNGGAGGIAARPTAQQEAAEHERHLPPVTSQVHQREVARVEPGLRASQNHGVPAIAATAHAGTLSGPGVVGARGAVPLAPHPTTAVHTTTTHTTTPHTTTPNPTTVQPTVRENKPLVPGGAAGAGAAAPVTPHPAGPPHAAPPKAQERLPEKAPPPRGNEHGGNPEHEQH